METVLNLTVPLSVEQLAALIKEQLPEPERRRLAKLLAPDKQLEREETTDEDYEEPTQAQLVAEMKEAVREVNLAKKGKIKLPTLEEFLNEL